MPPAPPQPAQFIARPNRFLIRCRLGKRIIQAFLPNPGRLQELLLPGSIVYIAQEPSSPTRKNVFTAVAVEREGVPIFLHTHRTNDVAVYLINRGKIPGWKGARVIGREIQIGRSRFDLLVEHRNKEWLVEVKSCTLFGKRTAMFPDAVTERGTRHLRELAELARSGRKTAVLFVVHWPRAEYFLPDYHTDLVFSQTMLAVRDQVEIMPITVEWKPGLSLGEGVKRIRIPWEVIEREAKDRGSYFLILKLQRERTLEFGRRENRQVFPGRLLCLRWFGHEKLDTEVGTPPPPAEKQILAHRLPPRVFGIHRRLARTLFRESGMSASRKNAIPRRMGHPRLRRFGLRLPGALVRDERRSSEIPCFYRFAPIFPYGSTILTILHRNSNGS